MNDGFTREPLRLLVSLALTASQTGTANLTLPADTDFELHQIVGNSSQDDGSKFVNNNFACQIVNQTTGRAWANVPIPQSVFCGNAFQSSFNERYPDRLTKQTVMQFNFQELSGNGNTVNVILVGYRLIPTGN